MRAVVGGIRTRFLRPARRAWLGAGRAVCSWSCTSRNGQFALVLLALILTFNISDRVLGIMANPFYLDLGFTKAEIASVAKVFGFAMTIAGAALGGVAGRPLRHQSGAVAGRRDARHHQPDVMALAYAGPDPIMLVVDDQRRQSERGAGTVSR